VRPEKVHAAEEIRKLMDGASSLILTTFAGLDSMRMNRLRRLVREKSGRYFVVKNRLFAIAARERGLDGLYLLMQGQVGVVFGEDDSLGLLKAVADFGKENAELKVLGGFFEGRVRTAEEMVAVAMLPPREVVAALLVGTIHSLFSGVVHVLSEPLQSLVVALDSKLKKREGSDSQEGS
jgi:large subunit ribosomal protein L10